MNRREFGKTALGLAAAAVIAPRAMAAEHRSIIESIVIDYERYKKRWRHLEEPDEQGHTFVYEDTDEMEGYRHFEFLGSDGLVVGKSSKIARWTECYDTLQSEFLYLYKPQSGKRFSHDEFLKHVEQVRDYFNGRIVPIEELAQTVINS